MQMPQKLYSGLLSLFLFLLDDNGCLDDEHASNWASEIRMISSSSSLSSSMMITSLPAMLYNLQMHKLVKAAKAVMEYQEIQIQSSR
ncbi:hypothetical protein HanXRQr2_Chr04g0138941 [Helianthus annuus]|uniref:Uncharacterized protein n=1 Tax=Helianthus annuus TaxID=4232 RepID=A0A9K3J3U3_HELAN|nr:hypothetical protein HanXRQr2_Chr04g0138941 [Helianthus annuus]